MTPISAERLDEPWLIIKRGYYFRPDAQGYTGLRDGAGRYSEEAARSYVDFADDHTMVRLSEAPEFSDACDVYVQRDYLLKLRAADEATRQSLSTARAEGFAEAREMAAGIAEEGCVCKSCGHVGSVHHSPCDRWDIDRASSEQVATAIRSLTPTGGKL